MPLLNTPQQYGAVTKWFHWITVALFTYQLVSAFVMTRLDEGQTFIGFDGNAWYNWHKTLGLAVLVVAIGRLLARRMGELPAWAPSLTETEKRIVHRAEQLLYIAMFLMPISGFVFVMAGDYGVHFANRFDLPNPIGKWEALGEAAHVVHVATALMLGLALTAHLGVVFRHVLLLRNGLLQRMLPRR